jgi:hypothetical protein
VPGRSRGDCSQFCKGADINQRIVYIKNRVIANSPNKAIEVGTMNPGDDLAVCEVRGPNGDDRIALIEAAGQRRSICHPVTMAH